MSTHPNRTENFVERHSRNPYSVVSVFSIKFNIMSSGKSGCIGLDSGDQRYMRSLTTDEKK